MKPRILFFASVPQDSFLHEVGFYRSDMQALSEAGFDVLPATSLRDAFRRDVDGVYIWWWTRALPLVVWYRVLGKPVFITGTFNWDPGGLSSRSFNSRPMWQRALIVAAARLASLNLFPSVYENQQVCSSLNLKNGIHFPHVVEVSGHDPQPVAGLTGTSFVLNVAWSGLENLRRKCVFELLSAFEIVAQSLPDVRLVLVGNEGDGLAELQQRVSASRISDRVHLLGRVSEAEKAWLLMHATVFASPSRFEGFGLAIAEAALMRLPILTSDVGAVREVVGNGPVYVDGRDPSGIASGLRTLLEDRRAREASGAAAQLAVSEYDMSAKVAACQALHSWFK